MTAIDKLNRTCTLPRIVLLSRGVKLCGVIDILTEEGGQREEAEAEAEVSNVKMKQQPCEGK